MFNEWLDILLYKKKPADIAGTTLGEGLKDLAIASFVVGILQAIMLYLLPSSVPGAAAAWGMIAPAMMLATIIGAPIMAVIGALIGGGILHVLCMLVGGKGTYSNYVGVLSKINAAISGTAGIAVSVIGILAALGGTITYMMMTPIIGLIGLVIGLWSLVLTVLATQAVQKLSLGRAIVAVIVIPLVILIVLGAIVGMIIFAAIMSAVAGGMGSTSGFASLLA